MTGLNEAGGRAPDGRHGRAADISTGGADSAAGGRQESLADVLAYLRRRRANAALVAQRAPEFADFAEDRRRQLDVMIEELEDGHHIGAAAVEAQLAGDGQ